MTLLSQSRASVGGLIATLAAIVSTPATAGADPTGVWINDTGRGAVEIGPCGTKLCGHVVWVKDQADAQKGCGKQIIGDVAASGGSSWDGGWIYSPERRRNFNVELRRLNNGNLRVMGYAGTRLFSRTMIWTPAPADLPRCTSQDAAAKRDTPASPIAAPAANTTTAAASPSVAPPPDKAEGVRQAAPLPSTPPAVTQDPVAKGTAAEPASSDEASAESDVDKPAGGLKIGGVDIENVLTKTAAGKCKLDLPWVKINFDCDRRD